MPRSRIVDYRIVQFQAEHSNCGEAAIKARVMEGYQPWGAPLASGDWILQAMILYVQEDLPQTPVKKSKRIVRARKPYPGARGPEGGHGVPRL